MSCLFALTLPTVSFLVADTRLNLRFRDGEAGHQDEGDIEFNYPDGRILQVRGNHRKLTSAKWGWAAGAGAFPLVTAALERVQEADFTPASLGEVLDSLYMHVSEGIRRDFPGLDTLHQTAVLLTYDDGNAYQLAGHRFDQSVVVPEGAQFVFVAPPDLSQDVNQQAVDTIKSGLVSGTRRSQICNNIRLLSEVFHRVHLNSSLVSDLMECGLALRDSTSHKKYLHCKNRYVSSATDKDVMARLVDVA